MPPEKKAKKSVIRRIFVNAALFILIANIVIILCTSLFFNKLISSEIFASYVSAKADSLDVMFDQSLRMLMFVSEHYEQNIHRGPPDMSGGSDSVATRLKILSRIYQIPVVVLFPPYQRMTNIVIYNDQLVPLNFDISNMIRIAEERKNRFIVSRNMNFLPGWEGVWIFAKIVINEQLTGFVGAGVGKDKIDDLIGYSLTPNLMLKDIENGVNFCLIDGNGNILYSSRTGEEDINVDHITNMLEIEEDWSFSDTEQKVMPMRCRYDGNVFVCSKVMRSGNIDSSGLYLIGIIDRARLRGLAALQVLLIGVSISAIMMLFGHTVTRLAVTNIKKPMAAIADASKKFSENDFDHEIVETNESELSPVLAALESVRQNVKNYKSRLDEVMKSRNEELQFALSRLKLREETLEQDMKFASSIQFGILPDQTDWRQMEFTPYVRQLEGVGGDMIDIIPDSDRINAYVADISGHGIPASLISMLSKIIFIYAIQNNREPEAIIREVNERMNSYVARQSIKYINYFTVFFVQFAKDGKFDYISAGHVPGILYRASRDACELLTASSSMIGGFDSDIVHFEATSEKLQPGDKLMLFTDGLINAKNSSGRKYGIERAMKCIVKNKKFSGKELQDMLLEDFSRFTNELPLSDDVSFLIVERKP
jgi:serine phosphatase RsbU (regulator of sigma subunit)